MGNQEVSEHTVETQVPATFGKFTEAKAMQLRQRRSPFHQLPGSLPAPRTQPHGTSSCSSPVALRTSLAVLTFCQGTRVFLSPYTPVLAFSSSRITFSPIFLLMTPTHSLAQALPNFPMILCMHGRVGPWVPHSGFLLFLSFWSFIL